MNDGMVEHLQMLVLSALFNPLFLALLVGMYILGRVLGIFMPWEGVVKPMVMVFSVGLALKLFVFQGGYDLYFMFGLPFIGGLWRGSRK